MQQPGKNALVFKSDLTFEQLRNALRDTTLEKKRLMMEITEKDFIGLIGHDTFTIFHASIFPPGRICVIEGVVSPTSDVSISTRPPHGLKVVVIAWVIFALVSTFTLDTQSGDALSHWLAIAGFYSGVILFCLIMAVMYVAVRNSAIEKLKVVLRLR